MCSSMSHHQVTPWELRQTRPGHDGHVPDFALSSSECGLRARQPVPRRGIAGGPADPGGQPGGNGPLAAGGAVGSNDALNAWQFGYSYFAVNSASTPGVRTPGLWDGLNFNPNTLGVASLTPRRRRH